ncbi:hypothetical protein TSOC_005091 [Tetrabaena socialis]|uniref:Uncharacterized protein n=1 Tax=Tetrabaena socialis TaxID=47790 RepID=A0A2J8A777_9CHLO|nr:hypothetical protein TSOC_005091 [Tetrabaena socialis]|eukprot:PNH08396.1 hypothetical protein TSOC_005091 [Tetrabaena socialis]
MGTGAAAAAAVAPVVGAAWVGETEADRGAAAAVAASSSYEQPARQLPHGRTIGTTSQDAVQRLRFRRRPSAYTPGPPPLEHALRRIK